MDKASIDEPSQLRARHKKVVPTQGTRTLRLLRRANLVLHFERLPRVDDVDDRARPRRFEVLEECTRVPAVRIGRIYALCREVV